MAVVGVVIAMAEVSVKRAMQIQHTRKKKGRTHHGWWLWWSGQGRGAKLGLESQCRGGRIARKKLPQKKKKKQRSKMHRRAELQFQQQQKQQQQKQQQQQEQEELHLGLIAPCHLGLQHCRANMES